MYNKQLIERITELFHESLQAKTGWGRNDVMLKYNEAVSKAVLELIDKQ
jgi:hypothetical protein